MENIAVFGGTFDPLHIGHLILAQYIVENRYSDKVLFIPSYRPPHKQNGKITLYEHRYKMLAHEILNFSYFELSSVEKDMEGLSYTYKTLERLSESHGERKYLLIIGQDQLMEFDTWYEYEKILEKYEILVFRRFCGDKIIIPDFVKSGNLTVLDNPVFSVSSSQIRERARKNMDFRYYVTGKTFDYIEKNRLYKEL